MLTYGFMTLYCTTYTAAASVTAGRGMGILHAWTEANQALWAGVLDV